MKKIGKIFLILAAAAMLLTPVVSYAQDHTAPGRYDPLTEGVQSAYLTIDRENSWITGIAPGITLERLNQLSVPGDLTAQTEVLGTGTVLTSEIARQSLSLVITGDVNGDGNISVTDMLMVKSHILGTELAGVAAAAGDVNADSNVSISDFVMIKAHLLELSAVTAPDPGPRELLILAPEETLSWNYTAAAYATDHDTLVQISPEGVLTAGSGEGTTFVYALDEAGQVLRRQAVTVLEGGLQVCMEKDTYAVCLNQSLPVSAVLNHPVEAALTWSTGDSAICSVSADGVLTGHAYGDTTLRVALANGASAEVPVRVMPPITAMELSSKLYKVKPDATKQLALKLTPAESGEEFIWTTSDPGIATVDENGVVTGVKKGTVTVTVTGKYSGLTASCEVKVCNVIQVAITFDDGPSSHTPKLLDYLKESGIKATFFLVCNRIDSYKGTVKRIVNEGHELGYHSYAHKIHTGLSTDKIKSDFEKSCKLVEDLTGATFTVWRAPGGNISDRVLNAIDLPHIKWTVDTRDWETRNENSVYRAIINSSDDGEIILLHDLYKTTVNGAIRAMKEMQAGDYEFLTVTELLSRNGEAPKNNTNYNKAPK